MPRPTRFLRSPGMVLRRAYLTMHRAFDGLFAEYGVTADQFVLLKVLSEEEGITQQELVRRICSDPNTIAAMVALLEKRMLVRREIHKGDGRARSVYLTPAGREAISAMTRHSDGLHRKLRHCFKDVEMEALLTALERVTETMALQRRPG